MARLPRPKKRAVARWPDAQFERPYGPPIPGFYAMLAQAHMHQYGTTSEQLAAVSVACRKHASMNPAAQMRQPITIDDVLNSKMIAHPLHLLDCSLVSDGGAAIVMTSAERAKDFKKSPVYILGVGEGHSHEHVSQAHPSTGRVLLSGLSAAEIDAAVREHTERGEAIYELDAERPSAPAPLPSAGGTELSAG
jgi:acetyl-CoA acetyltransferase